MDKATAVETSRRKTGEADKRGKPPAQSLTRALPLVAGADLLPGAVAGVSLEAGGLAQPKAPLPARVAGLAAEAPVVPAAPVTPTCNNRGAEHGR